MPDRSKLTPRVPADLSDDLPALWLLLSGKFRRPARPLGEDGLRPNGRVQPNADLRNTGATAPFAASIPSWLQLSRLRADEVSAF